MWFYYEIGGEVGVRCSAPMMMSNIDREGDRTGEVCKKGRQTDHLFTGSESSYFMPEVNIT